VVCHEGEEYDFNCSHVWLNVKTEFGFEEGETEVCWHVRQENRHAVMETDIRCDKKDMLWVNYEAPDGSKRHNRLWNGGNGRGVVRLWKKDGEELCLVDEFDVRHVGCEYGEYDEPEEETDTDSKQ
jgi:hypothetical protein